MKTPTLTVTLLAGLLGACATPGRPAPAPTATAAAPAGPRDCRQIDAERTEVLAAQHAAQEKKGSAWKAIVPFAVAGRVVGANGELRASEQRLAALNDEARRLGCRRAA